MICRNYVSELDVFWDRNTVITYLQSKYGLAAFEDTPCHSTTCPFAETSKLNDPTFFTRYLPTCVIQIFHIERSPLFEAQFLEVRQ